MSKRFIDTNIWDDEEYQNLEAKYKLLFFYLICKCSPAGFWKPNLKLASFQLSIEYRQEEVLELLKEHIEVLKDGRWFLKKFIKFQYGELSETCNPHKAIIAELDALGYCYSNGTLQEGYFKGNNRVLGTLQEQEKEKEQDIYNLGKSENPLKKSPIKTFKKPTEEEVIQYGFSYFGNEFEVDEGSAFYDHFESNGWKVSGKAQMKDWQAALRNWHRNQTKFKKK